MIYHLHSKRTNQNVLDVDHVVICAGQVSNMDLYEQIKLANPNVQLIGGAYKAAELDAKEAINHKITIVI